MVTMLTIALSWAIVTTLLALYWRRSKGPECSVEHKFQRSGTLGWHIKHKNVQGYPAFVVKATVKESCSRCGEQRIRKEQVDYVNSLGKQNKDYEQLQRLLPES